MKAFENIIVRRKLASFRPVFPHDDPSKVENIDGIYDNILEYSRPGLYPESVTRAAWQLLLLQIGNGPTSPLVQALAKRSPIEAGVFLSTLMTTCMSDVDELNKSRHWKEGTAMVSSSSKEMLVLPPVLSFIAWIATQSDWVCQAILDAGVLDMLLHVYIVYATLFDTAQQDTELKEVLRGACRLILAILTQSHQHQKMVFDHPVCILWPDLYSPPPDYSVKAHVQDRCVAWRRVDRLYIMRRAITIYKGDLWKSKEGPTDVCADIVEFTDLQFYNFEIVDLAFLIIFKQIVSNSAEHLISILARGSYESTVRVFSGIIRLWLEHIGMQIGNEIENRPHLFSDVFGRSEAVPQLEDIHKAFCSREKEAIMVKIMNLDTALYHMLRFATEAAKQNATVRLAMLGAGSLALPLTAFANAEFRLSSLISDLGKEAPQGAKLGISNNVDAKASPPISLAAINAEASTLSFVFHSSKFKKSWYGQSLSTRLSLCSSLVFSLLGKDEWPDEGYEVTRALFRKIFVVEL